MTMIHRIKEDFYFIQRGMLNANHLVFTGAHKVLIDTGHPKGVADSLRLIQSCGVEISEVDKIISTHCHADHVGANAIIQEKSNCRIALHPAAKAFIDQKNSIFFGWEDEQAEFFRADEGLTDGQEIGIANYVFKILHTPGHAFDGLSLYEEQEKILISADALWENDLPPINFFQQGGGAFDQLGHTLEKLASLDVRRVFPGHGASFTDFSSAIQKSQSKLNYYLEHWEEAGLSTFKKAFIYDLLRSGKIEKEAYFPSLLKKPWFRQSVDLYFQSNYEQAFRQTLERFQKKGIILLKDNYYQSTVRAG